MATEAYPNEHAGKKVSTSKLLKNMRSFTNKSGSFIWAGKLARFESLYVNLVPSSREADFSITLATNRQFSQWSLYTLT